MTPPLPPVAVRSHRNARPSLLERWKDTEPVRLYVYGILAAALIGVTVAGIITDEMADALRSILVAVLVAVPGAEAARASVISPARRTIERLDESTRWAAIARAGRE